MKLVPAIIAVWSSALVSTSVAAQPTTPQPEQAKEVIPQTPLIRFGRPVSTSDMLQVLVEQYSEFDVIIEKDAIDEDIRDKAEGIRWEDLKPLAAYEKLAQVTSLTLTRYDATLLIFSRQPLEALKPSQNK